MRDVVHHVLEHLGPVGAPDQAAVFGADFALPGGCDFVMVYLDFDAHLFQCEAHGGADIVQRIDRRNRKIPAFHAGAMPDIATLILFRRAPGRFLGFNFYRAAGHVGMPGDGVENEKFGLGPEIRGVADAGRLQVSFAALRQRARVAVIALAIGRLDHVAGDE